MMKYSVQNSFLQQPGVKELTDQIPLLGQNVLDNPEEAGGWGNLGVALRCSGKLRTAIALYRRALSLEPNSPAILSNLAGALRANGDLKEAVEISRRSIQLQPAMAAAHFNLGLALEDSGRLTEALQCYDQTLLLEPKRGDAAVQRAFTLLRMGNFAEGFAAYEKRLQFEPMLRQTFSQPLWDGQDFSNKTLLLYSEQGLGDTLQFIRYCALAKQRGGEVIVSCQPPVAMLAAQAQGVDRIVLPGRPLPPFHYHASLMSMPFIFKTNLGNVPQARPYLSVPTEALNTIRLRPSNLFKVGIVWASGHETVGVHDRSTRLDHFLKLLELPQVALYSLQVGSPIAQLEELGCEHLIQNVGKQFKDFSCTADAIRQLDLIISVDTAVVHLAAAMGKPVWLLLPYAAEWRWLQGRTDSPWYQSVKLYRQQAPFGWDALCTKVAADLRAHLT